MDRGVLGERVERLLDLDPARIAVLLIDFQRDFCGQPPPEETAARPPDTTRTTAVRPTGRSAHPLDAAGLPEAGSAGTADNARAAWRADEFAAGAAALGARVIYSRQVLELDRLTRRQRRWEEDGGICRAGTDGAELFLPPVEGSRVVRKDRFDVWRSTEFLDTLAEWEIDGLIIGGVELQCCVLYGVLGADERGFHYAVPRDLVSGIDSCRDTSNRAVLDYLGFAHPAPATARELLARWRTRTRTRRATGGPPA